MGELIEYGDTSTLFSTPQFKKDRRLYHGSVWMENIMTLRNKLIESLEILKKDVAMMADLALSNIREGLYAFKNNDQNLAREVMAKDVEVDRYEEEIAKKAHKLWREPLASDLRLVTGILKLITDIERIGDHASDIAEMTLHLDDQRNKRLLPITSKMAEIVEQMVLSSIQGFSNDNN